MTERKIRQIEYDKNVRYLTCDLRNMLMQGSLHNNDKVRPVGCCVSDMSDEAVAECFERVTKEILEEKFVNFKGYRFTKKDEIYKALQEIGSDFFYQERLYREETEEEHLARLHMRKYGNIYVPEDMTDEEMNKRLEYEIELILTKPNCGIIDCANGPISEEALQEMKFYASKYGKDYLKYGVAYCKEHYGE